MDCPVADTRNRYEGRGSGDRIARLKTAAINARPMPWKRDASIITEVAKAGECCQGECRNFPCPTPNIITLGATGDRTATVTGVLQMNGTLRFDLFTVSGCVSYPWCSQILEWNIILPSGFTKEPVLLTCGTASIIDTTPAVNDYPKTVGACIILSVNTVSPAPDICRSGLGGPCTPITFTLQYP